MKIMEKVSMSAAKFAIELSKFIEENSIEYNRVSENEIIVFIYLHEIQDFYELLKDNCDFSEDGLMWFGRAIISQLKFALFWLM